MTLALLSTLALGYVAGVASAFLVGMGAWDLWLREPR